MKAEIAWGYLEKGGSRAEISEEELGGENGRGREKNEEFSVISMWENAMMKPIILHGKQSINKVVYKKIALKAKQILGFAMCFCRRWVL